MKTLKAKLISTIVAVAGAASVLGFGLSSFAWFGANKKTIASGMVLRSRNELNIAIEHQDYEVYGYDLETDEPVVLSNDLTLGEYNIFMPFRNSYNRRIIRMTLIYPKGVTSTSKISIKINCLSNLFDTNGYVDTKISNLIQFKFFDNYNKQIHEIDDSHTIFDVYQECCTIFDGINDFYTFVDTTASEKTENNKDKEFEVNLNLPEEASGSNYKTDFFIEYNYNDQLVDYYKNNSNVDFDIDFFKEGNAVPFDQDVQRIEFDLVE